MTAVEDDVAWGLTAAITVASVKNLGLGYYLLAFRHGLRRNYKVPSVLPTSPTAEGYGRPKGTKVRGDQPRGGSLLANMYYSPFSQ
jgi:hypothetical protein